MVKNKEIHFYKDSIGIYNTDNFFYSHNSTINAIKNNMSNINTFSISALDFSHLLENDYQIYLHENGKSSIIKEGNNGELTDKDIKKSHDIKKLWIGGAFEEYFYNNKPKSYNNIFDYLKELQENIGDERSGRDYEKWRYASDYVFKYHDNKSTDEIIEHIENKFRKK